jgi:sporulation protein YlmC with PRC-barrel domain
MLAKYMTAGLLGSALLATVAFAQGPAATDSSTMKPADSATVKPADSASLTPTAASDATFQGTWRASKLVGLNVYNDNNESLGSISDMLTDKSGNIKAVVIGVGGFLGVGEHLVAVSWDKMKFVDQPVAYTGASNAPNATGNRPAPSTTTGAAPTTTAPASPAKSNPWYPDHAMLSATKDQLKAMPEFKYSN